MLAGEAGDGVGRLRPVVDDRVGGNGDPGTVEDRPHVGLVDGELEGRRAGAQDVALRGESGDDVEVDLLVVEGDDGAALAQRAEVGFDEGRADDDLGRDGAGGVVGS